ncbi:MAG: hypothetical protein ACKO7D_04845 [Bacteroidota bacterium]
MKKILLTALACNAFTFFGQIQEERVLEDGTHEITIIAKNYTKEEIANFKYHRIPSTQEILDHPTLLFSNSCIKKLETNFNLSPVVDSTLEKATKILFEEHIGFSSDESEDAQVSFHQIWTLSHSTGKYHHENLSESFLKMIGDNGLQNHFDQNPSFFCQEYKHNNKYYLVAILTNP